MGEISGVAGSDLETASKYDRFARTPSGDGGPASSIDEETARRIRGEQVAAIVELTPMSATVNIVASAVVVAAFQDRAAPWFLGLWFAAVASFTLVAMRGWWRSRGRTIRRQRQFSSTSAIPPRLLPGQP